MRHHTLLLIAVLAASLDAGGCSPRHPSSSTRKPDPPGMRPGDAATARLAPTAADYQRDLAVVLRLKGTAKVQAGTRIDTEAWLVNRSKTRTYPVIRSGDGSENGWREPYLGYARQQQLPDGRWKDLPAPFYLRCGLYAHDWTKDLVALEPGQRIPLKWLPSVQLPAEALGRFRVQVVYRYDQGRNGRSNTNPLVLKSTRIPAFALRSNAVVVQQIPGPLGLKLEQLQSLKKGASVHGHDVLQVTLVNRSKGALNVVLPGAKGADLRFELFYPMGKAKPKGSRPPMAQRKPAVGQIRLAPGSRKVLLGPGGADTQIAGSWSYPAAETFQIRAVLTQPAPRAKVVYSNWITVQVQP